MNNEGEIRQLRCDPPSWLDDWLLTRPHGLRWPPAPEFHDKCLLDKLPSGRSSCDWHKCHSTLVWDLHTLCKPRQWRPHIPEIDALWGNELNLQQWLTRTVDKCNFSEHFDERTRTRHLAFYAWSINIPRSTMQSSHVWGQAILDEYLMEVSKSLPRKLVLH